MNYPWLITNDLVPPCLDRADGLNDRPGTPMPEDGFQIDTSPENDGVIPIEELPDSPEIERAEQATITHRFKMGWNQALVAIQMYGRGAVRQDSYGNMTKVLSARLQHSSVGVGELTLTEEGLSFDSPPDQFSIEPIELGVNILKHPRYFYALEGETEIERLCNQDIIRTLQNYFENVTAAYRDYLLRHLHASVSPKLDNAYGGGVQAGTRIVARANPTPPISWIAEDGKTYKFDRPLAGTDLAKHAAMEIIQKYWRNEETPYIVGWQIMWSQYYYAPQYLHPGGTIEDPIFGASPQLPDYFWGVRPPGGGTTLGTVFDMVAQHNPQCYSEDGTEDGGARISWLRKADIQRFERTWFRVDRIWWGTAIGYWDAAFFNSFPRPSKPGDYQYVSPTELPKSTPIEVVP